MNASCPTLGNIEILKREKTAFLSSRKVPPDVVMKSYDWAARASDAGTCVIGGFQSALERDVLKLLLKGGRAPVVMVLARKMWRIVPTELREPINAGRLLVVSPVSQKVNRVSEETALMRNRYVLENCSSAVFASLDPNGSLNRLLTEFPHLLHRALEVGESTMHLESEGEKPVDSEWRVKDSIKDSFSCIAILEKVVGRLGAQSDFICSDKNVAAPFCCPFLLPLFCAVVAASLPDCCALLFSMVIFGAAAREGGEPRADGKR